MNAYISMLLGVICAGLGGELFVRAVVGLAQKARVAPRIVATTVAAFATSSPELSVAVNSAIAGHPEIAFGNVLGANVINISLILAIALIVAGMNTPRESVKRDFPVSLLIPFLIAVLGIDGSLSRIDGLLMLCLFLTWVVITIAEGRRMRQSISASDVPFRPWKVVIESVAGLSMLFLSGSLIVAGAGQIAETFGIDPFIVGATIVAVGTTTPELATTLISLYRGHDEIGLGTILGSNIFNGLFIVSTAAIIRPIPFDLIESGTALAFGAIVIALAYPDSSGRLTRRRGILLVGIYFIYLVTLIQRSDPIPTANDATTPSSASSTGDP